MGRKLSESHATCSTRTNQSQRSTDASRKIYFKKLFRYSYLFKTPLHLAVVKGHIEIVEYLVREDAKLDVIDNDRRTPLIKAVLSGNQNPRLNYQICEVLINGGAGDCREKKTQDIDLR